MRTGQLRSWVGRPLAELLAAVLTGAVPILFEEVLHPKAIFIAGACTFWLAYVVFRARREPGVHGDWGVSMEGFGAAFRLASLVGISATIVLGVFAASRGTLGWSLHFLWTLLLYPLWGIVQQFIVQAMGTRNLLRLGVPRLVVAMTPGVLFAIAHWPDALLMGASFGIGLAFTLIYLRLGNLLPLGIWHGWLGACFYFWILGRDSWAEFLGPTW